ncbi:MAG: RibD family protein [Pseudonocardiaceae bacterium]
MVTSRPHLLLSVAMSIDDMRNARLMLSNEADFDRVDEIRAGVDAILVGANTIRRDNPRLLVRSAPRRRERVQRGVAEHPMKVERLMVESGSAVHTQFLTAGLVDEIHLVIAPFFVGDPEAPRFVHPGRFPQNPEHPMTLAEARQIGNEVLLRYVSAS